MPSSVDVIADSDSDVAEVVDITTVDSAFLILLSVESRVGREPQGTREVFIFSS